MAGGLGENLVSMARSDYERLLLLFRRSHGLPQLPGIAIKLIEAVDSGDASSRDLERIISADPVLASRVLRLANTATFGSSSGAVSTMPMAIMRLGQRSVRALAVSLLMQNVTNGPKVPPAFAQRLANHSLFVAFLSRYIW